LSGVAKLLNFLSVIKFPISRPAIDELDRGTVSLMPQGIDKTLSVYELRDILAFLSTCKSDGE